MTIERLPFPVVISNKATNEENILSRKCKAYGLAGDILAILDEVPFGSHHIEAGITMRNSMFVGGILTNCSVWYSLRKTEIAELEKVDEYLIRKIVQGHSKCALEILFLENGIVPLRFLIQQSRISYLHHILTRNEKELIPGNQEKTIGQSKFTKTWMI